MWKINFPPEVVVSIASVTETLYGGYRQVDLLGLLDRCRPGLPLRHHDDPHANQFEGIWAQKLGR
jgi:hypothetical protein